MRRGGAVPARVPRRWPAGGLIRPGLNRFAHQSHCLRSSTSRCACSMALPVSTASSVPFVTASSCRIASTSAACFSRARASSVQSRGTPIRAAAMKRAFSSERSLPAYRGSCNLVIAMTLLSGGHAFSTSPAMQTNSADMKTLSFAVPKIQGPEWPPARVPRPTRSKSAREDGADSCTRPAVVGRTWCPTPRSVASASLRSCRPKAQPSPPQLLLPRCWRHTRAPPPGGLPRVPGTADRP